MDKIQDEAWSEPKGSEISHRSTFRLPKQAYDIFMEEEGVPIYRDIGVENVMDLPTKPWKRMGGRGTFIQLDGTENRWGMYLVEVPAAGALNIEHHVYDEVLFVLEGRGTTEVWQHGSTKKQVFEWQKGSLFAIPLNAYHRIVNATSTPATLLVGTGAPLQMNLVENPKFVFDVDYPFTDRFDSEDDYYKPNTDVKSTFASGRAMWRTNVIPDLINCDLPLDNRRSPGYRRIEPRMASGRFRMFCGQHSTGMYSTAHKHLSGAVLICIKGKGYTYTWPADIAGPRPWESGHADLVKRQAYEPVGMVSAAPMNGDWFHQHFGVSKEPLRLLVFMGPLSTIPGDGVVFSGRPDTEIPARLNVSEGGTQILYRDEDPYIREEFESVLAEEGVESEMTDEVLDAEFAYRSI